MLHMVQLQSSFTVQFRDSMYSTAQRKVSRWVIGYIVCSTVQRQYVLSFYSTVLQYRSETVGFILHTAQTYSSASGQYISCLTWYSFQYSSDKIWFCTVLQYSLEWNTIWKGSTCTVESEYNFLRSSVLSTAQRQCDFVRCYSTAQRQCDLVQRRYYMYCSESDFAQYNRTA